MKTLLQLPDENVRRLEKISQKLQVSRSEVIRQAIQNYLEKQESEISVPDVFGLWKKRKIDAVAYQRKLREEWE